MTTRYKIKENGIEILDLAEREPFRIDGVGSFPSNWLLSGGTLPPTFTSESYVVPPAPPLTRWRVGYINFLDQLSDADAELVTSFIASQSAKVREKIRFRGIWSDDAQVRTWLIGKGYDPDDILAR